MAEDKVLLIGGASIPISTLPEATLGDIRRLKADGLDLAAAKENPDATLRLIFYSIQAVHPAATWDDVLKIPMRLMADLSRQVMGGIADSDF